MSEKDNCISFSIATVPNHHKLNGLKKHKLILSLFSDRSLAHGLDLCLETHKNPNQGLCLETVGENMFPCSISLLPEFRLLVEAV